MTNLLEGAANDAPSSTEPHEAAAMFRVDADGVVREWNDAMEKLSGFPRKK